MASEDEEGPPPELYPVCDALYVMRSGRCPNDDEQKVINKHAMDNFPGPSQAAVRTFCRMADRIPPDAESLEISKKILEDKDVPEEVYNVLDEVAEKLSKPGGKPGSQDIVYLYGFTCAVLDMKSNWVQDPEFRNLVADEATVASGGVVAVKEDEEEVPEILTCTGQGKLFFDGMPWMILTFFNTAWALFSVDFLLLGLPKGADVPFAAITFFAFLCFLGELVGNLICKRDYGANEGADRFNFFFLLDFIGTFSLIPDFLILFMDEEMEVPDQVVLARVARAARIGARMSRLSKIFRFSGGQSKFASILSDGLDIDMEEESVSSQVGANVADGISKKIVALVIVLLVCVPIVTYTPPEAIGGVRQTKQEVLRMYKSMKGQYPNLGTAETDADYAKPPMSTGADTPVIKNVDHLMKNYQSDAMIYFTWNRNEPLAEWFDERTPTLRKSEIRKYGDIYDYGPELTEAESVTGSARVTYATGDLTRLSTLNKGKVVIIDLKPYVIKSHSKGKIDFTSPVPTTGTVKLLKDSYTFGGTEYWVNFQVQTSHEAAMNIWYMVFIILIFVVASMVFMSDVNTLVIDPVEGMTTALNVISKNVMDLGGGSDDAGEAHFIENSVVKIVSLLKVSFGEAGTKIIEGNMSADSDKLNTLIPGKTVYAIYGMCDIRSFTATTEALNEEIVIYVNEFATIVHEQTQATDGAPNKNVGDSFLSVWKDEEDYAGQNPLTSEEITSKADMALHCYRKSIYWIRKSPQLGRLVKKKEITDRFPPKQQEFGGYLPRMGFGLHYGTAIEGAVGTDLKMDASYLGPHVDLSDVLEAQTKEMGTPILMSEQFYDQLSDDMKSTCRLVDRVTLGAINTPFKLYAANIMAAENGDYFDRSIDETYLDEAEVEDPEVAARIAAEKEDMIKMGIAVEEELDTMVGDPLLVDQWKNMIDPWNDQFEVGVNQYIDGDWDAAQSTLQDCLDARSYDKPTMFLLKRLKGGKPSDWDGYWSGHS